MTWADARMKTQILSNFIINQTLTKLSGLKETRQG